MKPFGSVAEYSEERLAELFMAYDKYVASAKHVRMKEVYSHIVNMPASRFWVSESHASKIISAMLRGKPVLDKMHPSKREMYTEIYRRVMLLQKQHPKASLFRLCAAVVTQSAPRFYITAGTAEVMMSKKAREKWREEKRKKLWPLLLYFS